MSDRPSGKDVAPAIQPAASKPRAHGERLGLGPPTSEPTDRDLMLAIANRQEGAFEELYDRFAGQVYAVCVRVLRQHSDAEAVLTEVFWEIWSRAERYNPILAAPRTYIMMVARSRAIDRKRVLAKDAERVGDSIATVDALASDNCDPGPLRAAVAAEDCVRIETALQQLSEVHREIIQLAYFEGLTHQEIADRLKKPLGTVKTHLRQSLSKLKSMLRTPPSAM